MHLLSITQIICLAITVPEFVFSAVTFKFLYFDNAEKDFESRGWLNSRSTFQQNIAAVGDMFCQFFDGKNKSVELVATVTADRSFARAAGGHNVGSIRGISARTGFTVYEPLPLSKLTTGANPYGYSNDIFLYFNVPYVEENYWLDPTPNNRTDIGVPSDKVEFLSIVLHELGHGLGYTGYLQIAPGVGYGRQYLFNSMSVFDDLSSFGGDGNAINAATGSPNPMFFDGPISKQVNGERVRLTNLALIDPLSSQNFYHLRDCERLMSGCYVPLGPRYREITCADMSILADLGYPMSQKFFNTCNVSVVPSAPVRAPAMSPVAVPISVPVPLNTPPMKSPMNAPVRAPVAAPMNAPVRAPMKAPVAAPIRAPVRAPMNAPIRAPIKAPVAAPIRAPVRAPMIAPVRAPIKAPVPAPSTSFICRIPLLRLLFRRCRA